MMKLTIISFLLLSPAHAFAKGQTQDLAVDSGLSSDSVSGLAETRKGDDSTGHFPNFFDPGDLQGEVCQADKPQVRLGPVGFGFFPLPVYRNEFGWDIGTLWAITPSSSSFAQARVGARGIAAYSERERKMRGLAGLKVDLARRTKFETGAFARAGDWSGEREIVAGMTVSALDTAGLTCLAASVQAGAKKYVPISDVDETLWPGGENTTVQFRVESLDLDRFGVKLAPTGAVVTGVIGDRLAGGDFIYRQVSATIGWSKRYWGLTARWGASGGHVPRQEFFDAAVDGGLSGVPIWEFRSKSLVALRGEGRLHVSWGFVPAAYGALAEPGGPLKTIWEGGISLYVYGFADSKPKEWLIRFDFPVFVHDADLFSDRNEWDLSRLAFYFAFPVPGLLETELTRYRYPNR